jgi:hypothetical protein
MRLSDWPHKRLVSRCMESDSICALQELMLVVSDNSVESWAYAAVATETFVCVAPIEVPDILR